MEVQSVITRLVAQGKALFLMMGCPFLCSASAGGAAEKIPQAQHPVTDSLPAWKDAYEQLYSSDWLVTPVTQKAGVYRSRDGKDLILYNGLLKRTFRLGPNTVCTDYKNMSNGQQLLRAVQPEARVMIDGKAYNIGGLYGQREHAYLLPSWVDQFGDRPEDFHYTGYTVGPIDPYVRWKASGWASNKELLSGLTLSLSFVSELPALKGLAVTIHYELADGLPLITKWLSIENKGATGIHIDRIVNEILATVEEESAVVGTVGNMEKQHGLYLETNYAFNNSMRYNLSDQTTHWKTDTAYTSQVNYDYQTPCLVEIYPDKAPGIVLQPGETIRSVRTSELLMDSYDRERRGLAIRKMYRRLAPWTTENPIFMHLVSHNDDQVRTAVDQCAATGYEALILSFGSHLNMEDSSMTNIARWKELADYAHRKGIQIGGYSLFSSRHISDEDDVISPKTGKPGGAFFGFAPCFGSKWGLAYRDKIKYFFEKTGFNIWENDGPYPGDQCASTTHPGHTGLDDSQWRQMEIQKELYRWLNEHNVYINAPDWYFLDGTHKIAIGYREVNFSLSRDQQKILNRQNIFDGTWEKTPAMGWGFVPLTKYQGGGEDAILEPLSQHLGDYRQLMVQYYGSGVQACYRGPRLYDTDTTRQVVKEVIDWYKKYRDILNADIIHLRRADGRDWDGILHVDPSGRTKGLLMLYNPLREKITRTIKIPIYYTGIKSAVKVAEKGGPGQSLRPDRDDRIALKVTLPAGSYSWYTLE